MLRHARLLNRNALDILYKITVRSILDYSLPIFYHTLNLTDKLWLDRIQYSAAKLLTGCLHTTSKLKLNLELGWEIIEERELDTLELPFFTKFIKTKLGHL